MAILSVIEILFVLLSVQEVCGQVKSVAKPGCQEACGSINIPYPFGIGGNCSAHETLTITCNNSFTSPRPFLNDTGLEVLEISVEGSTIRVNNPVITANCESRTNGLDVILSGPFTFSDTHNRFTAMGCNNLALITRQDVTIGGCMSFCNITSRENSCFGINCCQTRIPPSLAFINASLRSIDSNNNQNSCKYAFIVDQNWFGNLTDPYSVQSMEQVPAVLNWRTYGICQTFGPVNPSANYSSLCGNNAFCSNQSLCSCLQGYEGNPYMTDGCRNINECETGHDRCQQVCIDTPGSYNCSCYDGWRSHGYSCYHLKADDNNSRKGGVIIATGGALGLLFLLAATWWLYKVLKRRKIRKTKEKFFKRNGGLLLQQVSFTEGNVEKTRLFTSKELQKATDNYNVNRILGQGGQGTVYKGMLTDGRIVAVKKSKIEDERKVEHFINEVVLLSQINHRNVVKLHGCCLETDVPLLVYEFISNGTLMQYIHEHNEDFPLTWDVRLRVASEVAGALSYLHSAASLPIYHRDIKSTNILLDEKYRAKVADFGTSRSIAIDQTHLTTRVQGTFGYLDPEYFQSSQFSDKSDVYSFGVVLVELLTGQKPILSSRPDTDERSLASYFIMAMEENRLFDILDTRVMKGGGKEDIKGFASLAYRCLDLNGRRRPTMKQVAAELEGIRSGAPVVQQHYQKVEYPVADELYESWDTISTSINSSTNTSSAVVIETLLPKK